MRTRQSRRHAPTHPPTPPKRKDKIKKSSRRPLVRLRRLSEEEIKAGARLTRSKTNKNSSAHLAKPPTISPIKEEPDVEEPQIERIKWNTGIYMCEQCSQMYDTLEDLQSHSLTCQENIVYNCPNCPGNFETKFQLLNHLKLEHSAEKFVQCIFCSETFVLKDVAKHFESMHKKYKLTRRRFVVSVKNPITKLNYVELNPTVKPVQMSEKPKVVIGGAGRRKCDQNSHHMYETVKAEPKIIQPVKMEPKKFVRVVTVKSALERDIRFYLMWRLRSVNLMKVTVRQMLHEVCRKFPSIDLTVKKRFIKKCIFEILDPLI